jgi:hypothetical protein
MVKTYRLPLKGQPGSVFNLAQPTKTREFIIATTPKHRKVDAGLFSICFAKCLDLLSFHLCDPGRVDTRVNPKRTIWNTPAIRFIDLLGLGFGI